MGASGSTYVGDLRAGKFEGAAGTMTWQDGSSYSGAWCDNKFHGQGVFTTATGVRFVGAFCNGLYVSGVTGLAAPLPLTLLSVPAISIA